MAEGENGNLKEQNGCYSRKKRDSKVSFLDTSTVTTGTGVSSQNKKTENAKSRVSTPSSGHVLSAYLVSLRPWSFPVTLTPVILGSVLYYKQMNDSVIPCIWTLLASCLTVLSVHAAGNLVNTYFDFIKGVDSQKSDDRTLVDHILDPNEVSTMSMFCYSLGCVGFLLTVWLSPANLEQLAFVFFGGLSSSFLYTGGLGLKYIALGDILIFLTFGPITVLFAYISQGGSLSMLPLIYAIPLALNTAAILHSNNARDMETDRKAGIITLAILLGEKGSYAFFVFLLFTPYCIFTILSMNYSKFFILPTLSIFIAFQYEKEFRNKKLEKIPRKIALLNLIMGLSYVIAVMISPRMLLPGFSEKFEQ